MKFKTIGDWFEWLLDVLLIVMAVGLLYALVVASSSYQKAHQAQMRSPRESKGDLAEYRAQIEQIKKLIYTYCDSVGVECK